MKKLKNNIKLKNKKQKLPESARVNLPNPRP